MKVWEGKRVIGAEACGFRERGKKREEGLKSDDSVGESYLC